MSWGTKHLVNREKNKGENKGVARVGGNIQQFHL